MPAPSVSDFNNAKIDVDDLASIINGSTTVTTRLGGDKLSVDQALSQMTVGNVTVYSAAATYTTIQDWVEESGVMYRPLPSVLPIGPEAFNAANWSPVNGLNLANIEGNQNSVVRSDMNEYLDNQQVADYTAFKVPTYEVGDIVEVAYRDNTTKIQGSGGSFLVALASDFTTEIANDPAEGVYVSLAGGMVGIRRGVSKYYVLWWGANPNGVADNITPINAAIAFCKTFYSNGQSPYNTGAFTQVLGTLVFSKGEYVYSGTMDFTNVYQYCNLEFESCAIYHTGSAGSNPVCIDIGDGSTIDIHQQRFTGNLTIVRATRDAGTIAIRNNGAHNNVFSLTLNIWGFERGIHHLGSLETLYDFKNGSIGNCTIGIDVTALAAWRPNIMQIRNVFFWAGGAGASLGAACKFIGIGNGAGSGISLVNVLVQGTDPVGGTSIIVDNIGEAQGLGTLTLERCFLEEAGEVFIDVTNSRVHIADSFLNVYSAANTQPTKLIYLRDKISLVTAKNSELFVDNATIAGLLNDAIINRLDGTTDGISKQINFEDFKIEQLGPTIKLTDVSAPIIQFEQIFERPQCVIFTTSYPSGNADDFSSGLVLNLNQLVSDTIGNMLTPSVNTPCVVKIKLVGSDGSTPSGENGHATIYGHYKSGQVGWSDIAYSAGKVFALTPAGVGAAHTLTFPASRAEWYQTHAFVSVEGF